VNDGRLMNGKNASIAALNHEQRMVTIRDRDTMAQERVPIAELDRIVSEKVDLRKLLKQL